MDKLRNGQAVDIPNYDFKSYKNNVFPPRRVNPSDVIILEGILIFHDPRVRELMNMKIFVDTDADVRLARRIRRDTVEKNRDIGTVLDQDKNWGGAESEEEDDSDNELDMSDEDDSYYARKSKSKQRGKGGHIGKVNKLMIFDSSGVREDNLLHGTYYGISCLRYYIYRGHLMIPIGCTESQLEKN
ncbi:uncharacterized protein LOC133830329 isoform X1 [Humulus lupulus]|uniref:uncharacterized protein LOC133830329 isoform X1 n=1 Tax=Humulus lupulus TaxID=3486 RepID=UPI002B41290B|nr:uncharacterized protein LOC133830329 isoform X1 [Humulus lupulus]XP_062116285.1 uncharacterized protein LOC133830329 isoform X1 [Humulus lupulus]XP_062116286.1 uncharacterized protein LOC133830329 isoform X1 [Humulus lupulus]